MPADLLPEFALIPAGDFVMGSDDADADEKPAHRVHLDDFLIAVHPVTNAEYERFVRETGHRAPAIYELPLVVTAGGPDRERTFRASGQPYVWLDSEAPKDRLNHPVTLVRWEDSIAYCAWLSGATGRIVRLPSEAEWEKAARGADGREYPWGNDADCARGNWGSFEGEGPCAGKNPGRPVPVGQYPTGASPYGVLDLGGNVWEWVADKYDEDPKRRVVRGGSCCSYFVGPRAPNRNAWAPQHRDADLGFRCAR